MTTHNVRSLETQRERGTIEAETWVAINTLVAEWVADAGRSHAVTERERALLEDAALCKLIVRRAIEHMSTRKTIFRNGKGGQLLPVLERLATFMNTTRLNLVAVGLRPDRTDRVPSLQEYLAARSTGTPTPPTSAATVVVSAAAPAAPGDAVDGQETQP